MPEAEPEVDEAAVRDALEDAYRRKADTDPNAIELFGYASALPAGTPDETALSIARSVIRDPPEAAAETPQDAGGGWSDADFSTTTPGVYPPEHTEYDAWMTHHGDKLPYAPWTDPDAPADCSKHRTTADECDCSARWKWGYEPNRRGFKDARLALDDDRLEGLVYIQTEADPFVFVDGDDVRCPETGDVHPAFVAILEHLGETYTDVSTSGSGAHAYYRGTLPDDKTTAEWEIDDEPFGANDELPAIELYSGKHVCVTTGEHVAGTPEEVRPWNAEVVRALLEANGEFDTTTTLETADGAERDGKRGKRNGDEWLDEETVDEALGYISANCDYAKWRRVGFALADHFDERTAKKLFENWSRGASDYDNKAGELIEDIAARGAGSKSSGSSKTATIGSVVYYAKESGWSPGLARTNDGPKSDYYDADLGAYVDGDPWSDPDAMLTACLMARAEGAVDRDAEPPTLALVPIVREYLGVDGVSAETKDMAEDVYLNELSRSKHVSGGELDL